MPASALTGIQPLYRTGDVVGGDPRAYSREYGGIPTLPKYVTDTQQTIGPDIYTQLTANLPGYADMVGLSAENIAANQRGEISQPAMGQLATAAAERNIGGGFGPGSPNEQAAYLANALRMSQGLQALSENQLTAAIQRTPIQQTQLGTQTKSLEEEIAQYAAAPEPAAAAREELANAMAGIGAGGASVRMPALTARTGGAMTADVDPLAAAYNWQNQYTRDLISSNRAAGEDMYLGQGLRWDAATGAYVPASPGNQAYMGGGYSGMSDLDQWMSDLGYNPATGMEYGAPAGAPADVEPSTGWTWDEIASAGFDF